MSEIKWVSICPQCKSESTRIVRDKDSYFLCECIDCGFSTMRCEIKETAIELWNGWSLVNNTWLESEDE
jgi:uncharacterized Zn finger protein